MKKVYIESASSTICRSDFPSADLKKELEIFSGQKFRRINRYILLGLSGVFKLPDIKTVDALSALYIGTKNGCVTETVSMLGQMYRDASLPMPFTFIASSSNMASYHIANALGISGGNYTLSHRYAPFELALKMAYWDMASEKSSDALVGCIDEAALPLEAFKDCVGMQDVSDPLEGGYWLRLTTHPRAPIAEVLECREFKTIHEVETYLPVNATVIRDDSFDSDAGIAYVGSNSGLVFIESLCDGKDEIIALVTQVGKHQISLLLVKVSREFNYN